MDTGFEEGHPIPSRLPVRSLDPGGSPRVAQWWHERHVVQMTKSLRYSVLLNVHSKLERQQAGQQPQLRTVSVSIGTNGQEEAIRNGINHGITAIHPQRLITPL